MIRNWNKRFIHEINNWRGWSSVVCLPQLLGHCHPPDVGIYSSINAHGLPTIHFLSSFSPPTLTLTLQSYMVFMNVTSNVKTTALHRYNQMILLSSSFSCIWSFAHLTGEVHDTYFKYNNASFPDNIYSESTVCCYCNKCNFAEVVKVEKRVLKTWTNQVPGAAGSCCNQVLEQPLAWCS